MWRPNIKAVKMTKLVHVMLQTDFDILSMLPPTQHNVDCSQLMSCFDRYQLQLTYPTVKHRPARNLQHKILQTTSNMFLQSQHLLHTLHKSFFFCFIFVFTFLEIIKHNMLQFFLPSSILKRLHNNSPILVKFFKTHADMIVATTQSNKTVLNEVKDN